MEIYGSIIKIINILESSFTKDGKRGNCEILLKDIKEDKVICAQRLEDIIL